MEETAIKAEIYDKIEHADGDQLKEINGLLTNYFNGQETSDEWESLSPYLKERIDQSIQQGNLGMVRPARDIIRETREKYGLNG